GLPARVGCHGIAAPDRGAVSDQAAGLPLAARDRVRHLQGPDDGCRGTVGGVLGSTRAHAAARRRVRAAGGYPCLTGPRITPIAPPMGAQRSICSMLVLILQLG